MSDTLLRARDAYGRHDWDDARAAFTAADDESPLPAEDLELLAGASWWAGFPDEAVDLLERAYKRHTDEGQHRQAAMVAVQLAYLASRRNNGAVASGWMAKAERLIGSEAESDVNAWAALMRAALGIFNGIDPEQVPSNLEDALALAERHDAPGARALAQSFKGFGLVNAGMWREGLTLIDEAAAAAVSGELDDRTACDVYCNTIATCSTIADYGRAGEWTEEAERWMHRNSLAGYPGICRVHRAEVKKLNGAYAEAEQQARSACDELERHHIMDGVGFAFYEIGEIRMRMGDLDGAEKAFSQAYANGSSAQPGMALLMLARGDATGAARAIARVVGRSGDGDVETAFRLSRTRLLPAQVTIALAVEDLDTARAATEELEGTAEHYDRPAMRGHALTARGALELAEGRHIEAIEALDKAWRTFRGIELPYESAQARLLLGQAKKSAGDESTWRLEISAARSVFQRLGSALDVRHADELLGESTDPTSADRRVTRTFMFTDIVTSTDLVSLIGDQAWDDLLRWHDRVVRSEFARHQGQEVKQTGDGFFVAFEAARDGVSAAVAIQRRLSEHRKEHGFAPLVRIGLHTAEASIEGSDYAGQGVHIAARLSGVAEGEQVVASADVIDSAQAIGHPISEARTASLKGVSEPVTYHLIDWR